MSKKYLHVRVGGEDLFLEFDIEDPDKNEVRLAADALGTRQSQVAVRRRAKGNSPPTWYRTATSKSTHSVKLVVS